MTSKRDRLHVINDMLAAIREKHGKIKPTHLLYKANLSHKMMSEYITELMEKGFIAEEDDGKNKFYVLTDKGNHYINEFGVIKQFMDSFGLS